MSMVRRASRGLSAAEKSDVPGFIKPNLPL
jgi:hypothetical protein